MNIFDLITAAATRLSVGSHDNTPHKTDRATTPHLLTVHKDYKIEDKRPAFVSAIEALRPLRRSGEAELQTLDSLILWAQRYHSAAHSALFASRSTDRRTLSLTAVADYHAPGAHSLDYDIGEQTARHGKHRAEYYFPLSQIWTEWNDISGQRLTPSDLGAFLEDHLMDVLQPSPALLGGSANAKLDPADEPFAEIARRLGGRYGSHIDLMNMSKGLQIDEKSNIEMKRDPVSGTATVHFVNEHNDSTGAPFSIPSLFLIAIPVFDGGDIFRLAVRLQYRKSGPTVVFTLTLHEPNKTIDLAFLEAVQRAADETGQPLIMGHAEVA